jgi:hypothetical protein
MALIREVTDAVELVAKTIENTRQIAAAFKDAHTYLIKRFPTAQPDLAGLLSEMRQTIIGLAQVSDVITEFQFTTSGPGRDWEPVRFNNMIIERKHRIFELRDSISRLKGSSGKMQEYATKLTGREGRPYWELFDVMGLARERAMDLGQKFNDLYVVDERIVELFQTLMNAAREALQEVSNALGPPGAADPGNVDAAARVLGQYSGEFKRLEEACDDLSRELESQIKTLK